MFATGVVDNLNDDGRQNMVRLKEVKKKALCVLCFESWFIVLRLLTRLCQLNMKVFR